MTVREFFQDRTLKRIFTAGILARLVMLVLFWGQPLSIVDEQHYDAIAGPSLLFFNCFILTEVLFIVLFLAAMTCIRWAFYSRRGGTALRTVIKTANFWGMERAIIAGMQLNYSRPSGYLQ